MGEVMVSPEQGAVRRREQKRCVRCKIKCTPVVVITDHLLADSSGGQSFASQTYDGARTLASSSGMDTLQIMVDSARDANPTRRNDAPVAPSLRERKSES